VQGFITKIADELMSFSAKSNQEVDESAKKSDHIRDLCCAFATARRLDLDLPFDSERVMSLYYEELPCILDVDYVAAAAAVYNVAAIQHFLGSSNRFIIRLLN
jgi:hypothetical protein